MASPLGDLEERLADLGDFIRGQRNLAALSLRRLSELSGISNPYLSQIERGLRKPSADILQQLARALSISAEQLYVRAGILDPDSPSGNGHSDVAEAIRVDDRLSDDQKHSLLRVYESFLSEANSGPQSKKH